MTAISVQKNVPGATLTVVSEHPATAAEIWRLWSNPRVLERWWGPPSHPATVTEHDLSAGGTVHYFMTGPEGDRYHGGWRVIQVDEPRGLEVQDFFANEDGSENPDMPTSTMVVSIEELASGSTRMTIEARYASTEAMEKVLEMGMEEGIRQALGQIEAILAEPVA